MSIIFSYQTKNEKEKKRLFSGRCNRANLYPLINEERQNDETTKMTGGIETQVAAGGPSKT
jgi:hypothetical protein